MASYIVWMNYNPKKEARSSRASVGVMKPSYAGAPENIRFSGLNQMPDRNHA